MVSEPNAHAPHGVDLEAVHTEPRGWDRQRGPKHHRPDIEWRHPATGRHTITDVAVNWTMQEGKDGTTLAADKEKFKHTDYKPSLKRDAALAADQGRQPDLFCPLGFAKNGAWGPSTARTFKEVVKVMDGRRTDAELWGWCAMSFERHWRQRIDVRCCNSRAIVLAEGVRKRQQGEYDEDEADPIPEEESESAQYSLHRG